MTIPVLALLLLAAFGLGRISKEIPQMLRRDVDDTPELRTFENRLHGADQDARPDGAE